MNSENPAENTAENLEGQPPAAEAGVPSPAEPATNEQVNDINMACVREVAVEIPAEVVDKEFDTTVQRYTKFAHVPGFRKGKVPASLIRNRYAAEIKSDVLETLVPRYFRDAVVKEGYRPVSQPHVHSLENEPGQPVRFKAAFEIMPDIILGNYQDLKLDVEEVKVTDEEVEAELQQLRERQAKFDPVEEDRPVQDGDYAQISFQAIAKEPAAEAPQAEPPADESAAAEEPPAEEASSESAVAPAESTASEPEANPPVPVKVEEVYVEIGGTDTVPQFSENLRGTRVGEERTFDVTYGPDYYDHRLAGKTVTYTTKIKAIQKKKMPELSDDFAKTLSQDFATLEDLKKRLHEGMLADRQHHSLQEAKDKLLKQLADAHDFPVPESMIQKQVDLRLEHWLRSLAAQGMRTEDMKRMDFKRIRAGQREAAAKEVKSHLVLEKIADAENIRATAEEVGQHVHILARQAKETPEALEQRLGEEGLDRIRRRIRSDKVLQFLYEQSTRNARNGAIQE